MTLLEALAIILGLISPLVLLLKGSYIVDKYELFAIVFSINAFFFVVNCFLDNLRDRR